MGNLEDIWKKYVNNKATPGEVRQLLQAFEAKELDEKIGALLKNNWDTSLSEHIDASTLSGDVELLEKIKQRISHQKYGAGSYMAKHNIGWRYAMAIAAGFMILVSLGFWYLATNESGPNYVDVISSNDSNQKISLPDGTIVWIKPSTKLSYQENFSDSRNVRLEGEAFFNVAKDKARPFSILSGPITTKILGTSFNISSRGSQVEVVVSTGTVQVASARDSLLLLPDQKAVYTNETGRFSKTNVNNELYKLWFEDRIHFDSIPMKDLALVLESKYGRPFRFHDEPSKAKVVYSFTMEAGESLEELIERINFLNEVELKIDKNMVRITTLQ